MDFITALLKKKVEDKIGEKVGGLGKAAAGVPEVTPIVDVPEEIVVQNEAYPKSKYKNPRGILEALFPSTFAPGTTTGDIYGIVKDALLVQGGAKPMFREQMQNLREAEALSGITSDPDRAIEMLLPVNAKMGMDLYNSRQDDLRLQETAAAAAQANRQKFEDTVHKRAGSLIYSATDSTYPALRKRYYDYYKGKGVEPAYELPETFDEAALGAARSFTMDPEDQARMAATRQYREERLAQGDRFESGRNARAAMTDRTRRSEGAANRGVRTSEGAANRTSREAIAAMRGGRSRPSKIKRVKQPDGSFKYTYE